eukprot:CAMPEP_0182869304 /NCGR_PEP_ID=MMETSP0034_2-20130328/9853_1 /TAXON_ID=156128 /ORGANISM="Nephroselmis pyriformis, Strain CCMP717" /LENGTH=103 /DNA_ID=CAMNT_0025001753 /DNA_START=53 /DNA_END=360 /DNA_ORIENTATION=-
MLYFSLRPPGEVSHDVILRGVAREVEGVLQRPLVGHRGLRIQAQHAEHGEAAVLDLLDLLLLQRLGVPAQPEGVEHKTPRVVAIPWEEHPEGLEAPDADVSGV